MNNNVLKYELGVNNIEEARTKSLSIIKDIKKVLDIKGIEYIETFIRMIEIN